MDNGSCRYLNNYTALLTVINTKAVRRTKIYNVFLIPQAKRAL